MSPASECWEELIVRGWGGILQLAQVNTWWSDGWLSLHCASPPTNVFLFQERHMICFSFSPLSYIVFSHKLLLQSLTQKCNKTWSYIGTASSEIGAGMFQERKYTGCTGETQGKEGCECFTVIYVHTIALSSVETVQNRLVSGSWPGVSIPLKMIR